MFMKFKYFEGKIHITNKIICNGNCINYICINMLYHRFPNLGDISPEVLAIN